MEQSNVASPDPPSQWQTETKPGLQRSEGLLPLQSFSHTRCTSGMSVALEIKGASSDSCNFQIKWSM